MTFLDGNTSIGTSLLTAGTASLATSFTSVATHTIKAFYAGDTNFLTSPTSAGLNQTVNKATTTVTATAPTPSVTGQSVTWTVTVIAGTPGAGTPTGTVTFRDNGASVGTGLLSGTTATFTNTFTSATTQTLSAIYAGDNNFLTSTSATVNLTVNMASTTATLTSNSVNPTVTGQTVTFTATVGVVSPGAGTPTGTVTFQDGGTSIGTVALNGGTASLAVSLGSALTHSITAVYNGDSNFAAAGTSASLTQTVTLDNTTTTVSSSSNPSVFGQTVTFTATVGAVSPGAGNPTGTVTFSDGDVSAATGSLTSGKASFTTSYGAVSSHTITASYFGDSNYIGSTTTTDFVQTVNPASATTVVSNASNPSVFGQSVTLTATVSATSPGVGTPTGMVTFEDGGVSIGTGLAGSGPVTLATSFTSVATHTITAIYAGDTNFNGGTSGTFSQTVNQASTTTVVSGNAPNPSVAGQSVTWTATVSVTGLGLGTLTGTVTFLDNGMSVGMAAVSSGTVSFTTTLVSAGAQSLSASYGNDTNFANSTAGTLSQTVTEAGTTTTVTGSSLNPVVTGQSVTFTATVSVTSPGTGNPTGAVTFTDAGVSIGTGSVSGGMAILTRSLGSAATHSIAATYAGDGNFSTSTSGTFSETVNQANTTALVTSTPNPSVAGQSVTLTATVSAVSPGLGTPTGTVTFSDGGTSIGTALLSGTTATLATVFTSAGVQTLTAVYNGDANYAASPTSANFSQTVNLALSPSSLAAGNVGNSYSQTISASGGTPSYSFAVTSGTLPTGLTLSSGGVLSGTPTATGNSTFTITATDSASPVDSSSQAYTITILAITINPTSLTAATVATSYSQTLTGSGGTSPYTFRLHRDRCRQACHLLPAAFSAARRRRVVLSPLPLRPPTPTATPAARPIR